MSATETAKDAAKRLFAKQIADGFKVIAGHPYRDADGNVLFIKVRLKHPETGEKYIRPMHLNGNHRWDIGESKIIGKKPLYYLPELLEQPDADVWITEGEQKGDALAKLGILATTSGSASAADSADWTPLKGRAVTIWPDFDEAGQRYADSVAAILAGLGCKVSLVDVAALDLPPKGDAVDWLAAHPGATPAEVLALPTVEAAKPTAVESERRLVVVNVLDFLNLEIPPRELILSPWLRTGSLNMLYAWRGVGKTHVALGVAFAAASGGKFLEWKADKPRKVLCLDGEMPARSMQERIKALLAAAPDVDFDAENLRLVTPDLQSGYMPDLATDKGQEAIEDILGGAELIIVDNLSTLVRATARENDAESWLPVMPWALRMRQQGRSVVFVHHAGKGGQQRGTSKREDILDCVIALRRPPDYDPESGAVFEVHFEKGRDLHGKDVAPFEARLATDQSGLATWTVRAVDDSNYHRVVALAKDGLSQRDIAEELGINKSTVSRHYKKAQKADLISGGGHGKPY